MDGPNKTAEEIMGEIQDLRQIIADFEAQDTALEDLKEELHREIEDHKRANEELSEERNKLQAILGAMHSGVTIRRLDYTLTYQNDLITKIYGDRTGQKCYRVFEGKEQICEGCPVELAFKDGQSHTSIRERVLPSGETTYWENTANPIKDASGKIVSCLEVNINITDSKKAEEALRKSKERFRLLYERSPLGYQSLDADGNLIEVNPAWFSLLGYERQEVIGRPFADFLASGFPELFKERFPCFKAAGEARSVPFVMVRKDGSHIDVEIDGKIGYNPDGSFKQTHCVLHDVTKRKQAEERLQEAKQQAEAANIAKSQFLANMSHEIRTPMSVITGFADLLISEEGPDEQKYYVDLIQKAGKSLLRIIDEILDVSRIESGKLEIKIEDCSLGELLDGIEVMMQPLAREEGLQFGVFRVGNLPATIQTDSGRVRQCLINLIGNAIKFTKRGHVHLKVSADDIQGTPCLRFDVEDTGIGIPQDKHVAVYETFSQADGSHTRQYGGTGLGLTITKQLAQLLGGNLSFTSQEGKGSVFSLVIPAGVDAESSALSGADEQTNEAATKSVITDNLHFSGKVLVADDAESSQILAQKILERYGLEVVIVDNGTEAVEKARQESFDLILMDIQMPGLNGLEATKKLREEGITTAIAALTAYAMPEDRDKCMAAGCDDYISKPIDQDELRRVLKKYVPAGSASA